MKDSASYLVQIDRGLLMLLAIAGYLATGGARLCIASEPSVHATENAPVGSFAELLDFRSVCRLKTWRTRQASGYDRGGGFFDSGNFLRVEDDRRYVLMDAKGPGCIDRMWFTYKSNPGGEPYDLLIYVDAPEKPAIQVDLDELFSGKHSPFLPPLAGLCGNELHPARYSYVPIGFQRSCKVVLVPTAPEDRYQRRVNSAGKEIPHIYYQITYRQCRPDTPVQPFRWKPEPEETRALAAVRAQWEKAGTSLWTSLADVKTTSAGMLVFPGQTADLIDIDGTGIIYSLHLVVPAARGVFLEATWGNAPSPNVSAPVLAFFGSPGFDKPVKCLWAGTNKGIYYCYLPMPFRRGAKIAVRSERKDPIRVGAFVDYRIELPSHDDGAFHARYYEYAPPPDGEDYIVLDTTGRGQMVGIVMDSPGHMEGDDRFFVDGEKEPSIHGTGTEDFFNFAWGLSHVGSLPLHGITRAGGSAPICYRFHLPAAIPFQQSLRVQWEHGHAPERAPNFHKGRYSGVVFYYRSTWER